MNFKVSLLFTLTLFAKTLFAQSPILINAHSHNDYKQKKPLSNALYYKFKSIEADVFLINNRLIVSHTYPIFKKTKTLEQLYIKPLFDSIQKNGAIYENETLILLIDIKSDAGKTYDELKKTLTKYKEIFSSVENGKIIQRSVTLVLTGNKPYKELIADTNRFMFIDENLLQLKDSKYNSNLCYMASTKYSNVLKWKGKGLVAEKNKQEIESLIALAHKQGKLVRLWASPENEQVWKYLLNNNIDLINTDELKRLSEFLLKKI